MQNAQDIWCFNSFGNYKYVWSIFMNYLKCLIIIQGVKIHIISVSPLLYAQILDQLENFTNSNDLAYLVTTKNMV